MPDLYTTDRNANQRLEMLGAASKNRNKWLIVMGLSLLLFACQSDVPDDGDRVLARVHNRYLHLSEMEGMFPPNAGEGDSVLIIESFVNRWTRDAILLQEAEANIPSDLNIDKLVRDYRASLIRSNYERVLVDQLLDSVVSQQELKAFYESNREQYQLETPIARCYFIKVPLPTPQAARLRELWNSGRVKDLNALRDYCKKYASVALLEEGTWYSVEEISRQMPQGTLTVGNVGSKREFTQQDGHHQYYFSLFELKNRRDIAPLAYVEKQARKVILHRRKLELLEEAKEQIYERELRRNNIEMFDYK